jgi:hypothetical protein
VIELCGEHLQELCMHCVFWSDSETTKLLFTPNKNLGGEGASDR